MPRALLATDQVGEVAVEAGAETMTMTTPLRPTITKGGQENLRTAPTNLNKAGDLDRGLPRWVVPPPGMPPDAWATGATKPTADGAVTAEAGITEKAARGRTHLDLVLASRIRGTRAPALGPPRGGRLFATETEKFPWLKMIPLVTSVFTDSITCALH